MASAFMKITLSQKEINEEHEWCFLYFFCQGILKHCFKQSAREM